MLRRLAPLVAVAVAASLGAAGCADDVSPAARIGDTTISHDDLLAEVEKWAQSPTLMGALEMGEAESAVAPGYDTGFVDVVLSFRVSFELHNAEFDRLGLEVTDAELDEVRQGLFTDPTTTAAVLDELGAYGERLIGDVARQFAVQTELAEGYESWVTEANTDPAIEVSPRYGRWDGTSGRVVAPEGPSPAPQDPLFVEP